MKKGHIPYTLGLLCVLQPWHVLAQSVEQPQEFLTYWYAGASIAEGLYPGAKNKDTDRNGMGYIVDGAHLGYRFNERWSGEFEWQNLGTVGTSSLSKQVHSYNQIVSSMRWHYPLLDSVDTYLKGGLSRWWEENDENSGFTGVMGLGASYALRENIDIRAEYQYTHNLSDILTEESNHHMAMFSLLMRFGQKESTYVPPVVEPEFELPEVKKTVISLAGNASGAFAHNSSYLLSTTPFEPALQDLKRYANAHVTVSGHTDTSGSEAYNLWLSERRALRVADYFASQGIDPTRIIVKAYGESQPIADNDTDAGRALNRRVEIELSMMED